MDTALCNRKAYISRLLRLHLCLCLLCAVGASGTECDTTQCKGPVRLYEELGCKPIYAKSEDCCAESYNCSHLSKWSINKCYINGHSYNIKEKLRDEDKNNLCEVGCFCVKGYNGIAGFECGGMDCFYHSPKKGCHLKAFLDSCCKKEVCPDASEKKFECKIDGKNYLEGEQFYPQDGSDKICVCQKGYNGTNVHPFCKQLKCGIELQHSSKIHFKCAPIFESSQNPASSCAFQYRCQNKDDVVIHKTSPKPYVAGKICKFGNLTMQIGDELNQATDYSSVCVKCVCEVPPTPTCQKLPSDECDITIHPDFQI